MIHDQTMLPSGRSQWKLENADQFGSEQRGEEHNRQQSEERSMAPRSSTAFSCSCRGLQWREVTEPAKVEADAAIVIIRRVGIVPTQQTFISQRNISPPLLEDADFPEGIGQFRVLHRDRSG